MGKQFKRQMRNKGANRGVHKGLELGRRGRKKGKKVFRGVKSKRRMPGLRGSRRRRGEGTRERREVEIPAPPPVNPLTNTPLIIPTASHSSQVAGNDEMCEIIGTIALIMLPSLVFLTNAILNSP